MNRRDFIAATSSFLVPVLVDGFGVKAFGANSPLVQSLLKTDALAKDRVLVIIYLNGGNDGLNTVIPLDQYSLYDGLRTVGSSKIALPTNSGSPSTKPNILPIGQGATVSSATTGIHPRMTGLKTLSDDGKLAIVHSVSYPTPSYSHYRATDIWMTGTDSNVNADTGWAGRYLEDRFNNYPTPPITDRDNANATMQDPLAIQIGYSTSTTLLGSSQSMAVAINDPASYDKLVGGGNGGQTTDLPCCDAGDLVAFIRQQQSLAVAYSTQIINADTLGKAINPTYPTPALSTSNSVSDQLKIVARLIGGGLKTKVYFISLGGFDNHAGQVTLDNTGVTTNATTGSHAILLEKLSIGIKGFQDDLKLRNIEDKVVGFTFSEFGRRANSNASAGTDHGVAAPMFVFGSSVKRQTVGRNPNLMTDLNGTIGNQDIKMQIDFRRIYWDILTDWFGRSKTEATSLLVNKTFDTVSLFTDEVCTIKTGSWHDEKTWSCGRVPFTSENARICAGHIVTLSANASVKNLQNYGNLTMATGIKLTVAGL